MAVWSKWLIIYVLSCALLLVFSGQKCLILGTQSPKYTRLKRITNQSIFMYTVVKSLYIQYLSCYHIMVCSGSNKAAATSPSNKLEGLICKTTIQSVEMRGYQETGKMVKKITYSCFDFFFSFLSNFFYNFHLFNER